MPELPEVETVRAGLARYLLDQEIRSVNILHPRATRRSPGGEAHFIRTLLGRRITAAVRRGKYLWCELGDLPYALVYHLGMSGQILIDPRPDMPRDHLRVRLTVGTAEVWFMDQRTFGHVMVSPLVPVADGAPAGLGTTRHLIPAAVAHIARDPLDRHCDLSATARRIRNKRTAIKRALLDQTAVSGIGNIYADESLWRARLHPLRATQSMPQLGVVKLLEHARDVMKEALVAGGTSFDALYVDVSGQSGWFERELKAYGRGGQSCGRCGKTIVREQFMNRSSYRCPACQRRPTAAHLAR